GRIINRFGDPIPATLYLEDLTNGKRLAVFTSDSTFGRYEIKLLNDRLYGFYAEYPGHYSISNNIDLRNEHRSLEVKKNIEMIAYENLVEENVAIRLNNIFFGSNEFQLQKESYTELERLSDMIKQNKKIKVEISGHTDNTNTYDFNMDLSQKRANSVKEYLLSQGVKKNQIIAKGYGYTKPLVSNNTERGRYLNRRVEFRFIFD
ncbi:MAG: OmpA family protein, partial [Cytophagaceae bacterium]